MCKHINEIELITEEFKECSTAFTAIGHETRQKIIIALLESECSGIRVGEITKKTHLSRPAISHHLQILKESGIINMRREGTKNYYYMDANETQWRKLSKLVNRMYEVVKNIAPIDTRNKDY